MKMLSKNILKQSMRNSWKLWTILTATMCFFITVMTIVIKSNIDRMANEPRPMGGGRDGGMNLFSVGMEHLYAQAFFSASGMGIMLMLIFLIAVGNKLVASEIDRGTMSFTLNTPITRKQVIFSKALFYILAFISMVVLMGLFGTVTSLAVGAKINVGKLWLVVFGCILFGFATSGICFFASCWFNKSGQSVMIGAGLPVAFFLLGSLSPLLTINNHEFLKYFSMNTLYNTGDILALSKDIIVPFVALFVIGVALYTIGIFKFLKKDLPL